MKVYPLSWFYYLSFIFFNAFVFLNMMIGIVISKMQDEQDLNKPITPEAKTENDSIVNALNQIEARLERMEKKMNAGQSK